MNGIIITNDIRNHLVAIDPGNKGYMMRISMSFLKNIVKNDFMEKGNGEGSIQYDH